MKRAELLELLAEFKAKIDRTDCGAFLIIAANPGGLTDVDAASNLPRDSQEKILLAMLARLRGAS